MSRLHRAARLGHDDEVAQCLADGEGVDSVGIRRSSALMLAAGEGHLPIVKRLLVAGANIGLAHPNRRTPLHFAASKGHLNIVRELVQYGADVNALSGNGCSPAIEAAQFNHHEVVAYLWEQGAEQSIKDRQGFTAEDWLERVGVPGYFKKAFPREKQASPEAIARKEKHIRKLMESGLLADEYAAKHGRHTLIWSYGRDHFPDAEAERWAHRVAEVLFTPGLLDECEERFLHGDELKDARKCRERRAKREARRK